MDDLIAFNKSGTSFSARYQDPVACVDGTKSAALDAIWNQVIVTVCDVTTTTTTLAPTTTTTTTAASGITTTTTTLAPTTTTTTTTATTVTDYDGNVYNVVTICGRQWLASDLKTTKDINGVTVDYTVSGSSYKYSHTAAEGTTYISGWSVPSVTDFRNFGDCLGTEHFASSDGYYYYDNYTITPPIPVGTLMVSRDSYESTPPPSGDNCYSTGGCMWIFYVGSSISNLYALSLIHISEPTRPY